MSDEKQLAVARGAIVLSDKVDPNAAIAQVAAVQKVMAAVMKEGTHFGKIPGTDQPSLYKAGAETLLSAFKIAVKPEITETRDGDHISYSVCCIGTHMMTGIFVGGGVGSASTAEEKYAWRAAVCPEEFEATPADRRRVKWNKGKWDEQARVNGPSWSVQQVRTNPSDLANTVLKMAKKRAQIDLTLTALAASDIFTQDLEDLPEEYRDGFTSAQKPQAGKAKNRYQEKSKTGEPQQQASGVASTPQVGMIRARLKAAGKEEIELCQHYKIESIEALPKAQVNAALDWIAGKAAQTNE